MARTTVRLVEIELALSSTPASAEVVDLLADAKREIDELDEHMRVEIPAFVPSDFALVNQSLAVMNAANLATGRRFVEWGSGIGVVTCLAVLAGFDAVGIEIEAKLVGIARKFARTHAIATQFALGSFVPPEAVARCDSYGDVTWLSTSGPDGYEELGLDVDDFDVVFAYPWPGEEQVLFDLFAHHAAVGALLLTYHGQEGLRLQRKLRR